MDPRSDILIAGMKRTGILTPEVEEAFRSVPRERFVPAAYQSLAYSDEALPLSSGSTVSQPSMIAIMLKELRAEEGDKVLEVGSGCGYVLALLRAVGAEPTGVEANIDLAAESDRLLAELYPGVIVMEGLAQDAPLEGPFDRVMFSAAVREIPEWSYDLLTDDGFVLAPVGDAGGQELIRATRSTRERTGQFCRFVPFLD